MKRSLVPFALCALPFLSVAQDLPQQSPKGKVEQVVGLTNVSIEYSRPSMKGRTIFGDLVPFGEIWRTGANAATTITFDNPVVIEGQNIEQGTYALFSVPGKDGWKFMLNKHSKQWGTDEYNVEQDIITFKVKPVACDPTETLTIDFAALSGDSARVQLRWEKTCVSFTLYADATAQGLLNAKTAIADTSADYRTYASAARFCYERNVMMDAALQWAQTSVDQQPKYWNTYTLALILGKMGKYQDAIETAYKSRALAEVAGAKETLKNCDARIAEWSKKMK